MITTIAMMLLQAATPTAAATGQELWGGITYGMPGREVLNRYPKQKVELTPECTAGIGFETIHEKPYPVISVSLGGSIECGLKVRDGLRAKYGEPKWTKETDERVTLRTVMRIEEYRFEGNGVAIDLKLNPTIGNGRFTVTYSRSDAQTMAGAL